MENSGNPVYKISQKSHEILCKNFAIYIEGDQINMAVFLWYLVKSYLSGLRYCTRITPVKLLFKRYQKNTAMFNW